MGRALILLPALLLGVAIMQRTGVPTTVWAMNLGAAVLGLLFWLIPMRTRFVLPIATIALLLPFAFAGMDGVHRWIALGGFRLHAAAIFVPIALVALARQRIIAYAIAITAILALQPDAAQATSFAAACLVLFPRKPAMIAIAILAALSFVRPDPLGPVPHVEEIFKLAIAQGPVWAIAATIALALLPLPFALRRNREGLALAVYVALTICASFWGVFPVPVMGFGVSPILGYLIALRLLGADEPRRADGELTARPSAA